MAARATALLAALVLAALPALTTGAPADSPQEDSLFDALRRNDTEAVLQRLPSVPDVNALNDGGEAPLHIAALNGNLPAVLAILGAGGDVDVVDDMRINTPLGLAAQGGHTEVVRALLAAGADVRGANALAQSPLQLASHHGHTDAVRLLLAAGADVNSMVPLLHFSPLHLNSMNGNAKTAMVLLAAGADVHKRTGSNSTALHMAGLKCHLKFILVLLAMGADPNAEGSPLPDGTVPTPLSVAVTRNCCEVVVALLQAGARVADLPQYSGKGHTSRCVLRVLENARSKLQTEVPNTTVD